MKSNMTDVANQQNSSCRFCSAPLKHTFVDLGMSPLCETFITQEQLNSMEPFYPLHTWVCEKCFLVQLEEYVSPEEIFDDYAYFSSYSDSWVRHAEKYCEMAISRFGLDEHSSVMEIASNDGYLLQHFVKREIPCLGIEPAANVAQAAIDKGIPTTVEFFGEATATKIAKERGKADLLLGNNVLAHVPNLNDFVAGLKRLLAPEGVITMEFPHLQRLIEENQFDTIYHEHFSYLSIVAVTQVFRKHGLTLFDVEELRSHGGSLRIFAQHTENESRAIEPSVEELHAREVRLGFTDLRTYDTFAEQVRETKRKLLEFLIEAKRAGKSVVAYGAPGKGNTLLNYCAIRTDFLDYAVDRNPYKHGRYTPGTHIPIFPPDKIRETKPDYVLILPWNLKDEITAQMEFVHEWGGRFVVPIPEVRVL
jgi:SAM-dependent methyltransferase